MEFAKLVRAFEQPLNVELPPNCHGDRTRSLYEKQRFMREGMLAKPQKYLRSVSVDGVKENGNGTN